MEEETFQERLKLVAVLDWGDSHATTLHVGKLLSEHVLLVVVTVLQTPKLLDLTEEEDGCLVLNNLVPPSFFNHIDFSYVQRLAILANNDSLIQRNLKHE